MPPEQTLHFSTAFCISCGTVTIDPRAKKVLLILNRSSQYLLPKGRKNPSETIEAAALRETFEETGIRSELLPHAFPHLAPLSDDAEKKIRAGEEARPLSTEPIAVQQREIKGVWRVIFWYLAQADSTVAKVEGTQEAHEQYDTVWADAADAPGMMSRPGDEQIVRTAIQVVLGVGDPHS